MKTQLSGFGRLGLLYWQPVDREAPAYWLEIATDIIEGEVVLRATFEPYWALQVRTREGWDYFSDPVSGADLVSLIKTFRSTKFPDVLPAREENKLMDRQLPKQALDAARTAFRSARDGLDWLPDWMTWRGESGLVGRGGKPEQDVNVFDLISGRLYRGISKDPDYWIELHAFGRPSVTSETVIRAQFFKSSDLARGRKIPVSTYISRPVVEKDLPVLIEHFGMTKVPELASAVHEEKSLDRARDGARSHPEGTAFLAANNGHDWLPPTLDFRRL